MTTTISEKVAHLGSYEETETQGDLTALFNSFRSPLLRYVLAFGICPRDGEDIVQEVFLHLYRHLQLRRSRHNLRGWVFRVAHNLALKRYSANRKHQLAIALHRNKTNALLQLDTALNPEEQFAADQERQRLLAVVAALPKQDQLCLHLRAEGLRYREIASVLGMSLGAVSISLTRSLKRLGRADEE